MYWVYVLWSDKLQRRYIGCKKNLEKRLKEHNTERTPFTSRGIPWVLIHEEKYESLKEARQREKFLKSGVGRKWLDERCPNYWRGV